MCIFSKNGQHKQKGKRTHWKAIALLLAVMTLFVSVFFISDGTWAKYVSKFKQTVQLIIDPTTPILAQNGDWYRADNITKDQIKSVTVVEHDYVIDAADYVEAFYADAQNKGTIKAYITKDAADEYHLVLSGNGYNDSNRFFANADSSGLFAGFSNAATFSGMDNLDTADVTDLSEAFSGCENAATISGTGIWNTAKVTDMSSLFSGCEKLTAVDVSGWNTAEVNTFADMFSGCRGLETADISSFDFSGAATLADMFSGCAELYSVAMPSLTAESTTSGVTDMSGMFSGTVLLTAVDVSGFDTENVSDMNTMFKNSGVQSLDLQSWNTGKAEDMGEMFSGCTALESVTVSQSFVVPTGCVSSDMFAGCTSIVGGHGTVYDSAETNGKYARIDTTNNNGYFRGETRAIKFDANGGTGAKDAQYVLSGVEDTLTAGCGTLEKAHYFFGGWNTAADGSGTSYDDGGAITVTEDTVLYVEWLDDTATFTAGSSFNIAVKTLAGAAGATADTIDNTITAITRSATAPADGTTTIIISSESSKRPICAWLDGGTLYYYTEAETVGLNADAGSMFKNMTSVTSVDCGDWDTSGAASFESLFYGCSALEAADTSSWNTSAATNMSYMFCGTKLNSLDLSNFNTENVKNMSGMFEGCKAAAINLSSFDTSGVTSMAYMFADCENITTLNLTGFDTAQVTNMQSVFSGCDSLTTIYAKDSSFVTAQVTDSADMFSGCIAIVGGAGTHYDADHITKGYAHEDSSTNPGYFTGDVQTITYHSNYITETSYTQNVPKNKDDALTPNRFTREGYTFSKWNTAANGTGTDYAAGAAINLSSDLELYAQWTENTYRVTYVLNDGAWNSFTPTATRLYTASLTLPTADKLTRTGYTFGGWYDNASYSGTALTAITANTAQDKTVYAKWEENEYSITYHLNSGSYTSGYTPITTRKYTQAVTLPTRANVTRTGYAFEGWYESADFQGSKAASVAANTTVSKEFYARWTPITYTVRFNSNSGLNYNARYIADVSATYDEEFTLPMFNNAFYRDGYTFLGYDTVMTAANPTWHEGDSAKNLSSTNGAVVTVYCIWGYNTSVLENGQELNAALKTLAAGETKTYSDTDTLIRSIVRSTTAPSAGTQTVRISLPESTGKAFAWFDSASGTVYWYATAEKIYFSNDCSYMFAGMENLETIDLSGVRAVNTTDYLTEYSTVTNVSHMYDGCASLTAFPTDSWDFSNITSAAAMYKGCASASSVNTKAMRAMPASDLSEMFYGCESLEELDFTGWQFGETTNVRDMLTGCTSLHIVTADKGFMCADALTGMWYNTHLEPIAPAEYFAENDGTVYFVSEYARLATFIPGTNFNLAVKTLAAGASVTDTATADSKIKSIVRSDTAPTGVLGTDYICVSESAPEHAEHPKFYGYPIYAWFSGSTLYYYSEADALFANADASNMFRTLGTCQSIDLTDFDTAKVTSMASMFSGCSGLTSLDVSGFDTTQVTNMDHMFSDCSGLTALDVSGFDTTQVTNMKWMFSGCNGLTSLDVSGFDTTQVTTMYMMFSGCSGLTSLDVSGFATANVTSMEYMFNGCSSLTTLEVSGFDTTNVTTMYGMFYNCGKLTTLDVSGFDTSQVTGMSQMFQGCSGLTSLDVSGFDTTNVTTMYMMFSGCSGLTSLDVSGFDTANVTMMQYMFYGCSGLTSLDVSGFDTAQVTNMQNMFNGCSGLKTIYASALFGTKAVTDSATMFNGCTALVGGNGTKYSASFLDKEYARIDFPGQKGYFTAAQLGVIMDGADFNTQVKKLSNIGSAKYVKKSDTAPASGTATVPVSVAGDIMAWVSGETLYWYSGTANPMFSADCSGMFAGLTGLKVFDFTTFFAGASRTNVTDISDMFAGCTSLETVNFLGFDMGGISDTSGLFSNCTALHRLNLFGLDMSGVTSCDGMLTGVSLTQVSNVPSKLEAQVRATADTWYSTVAHQKPANDTSDWAGYTVQLSSGVAVGTPSVTAGGKITSYAQTLADGTFYDHADVTYATLGAGDAINMAIKSMASGTAVTSAGTADTKVTAFLRSMTPAPSGAETRTVHSGSTEITAWYDSGVVWYYTAADEIAFRTDGSSGNQLFYNFQALRCADISGWNTLGGSGQSMYCMFYGCSGLTSLDVSGFDTAKVTSMSNMFYNCKGLTSLDVSGFDTSQVTNMQYMFSGCSGLTSLDLSGFDTAKVTTMQQMFSGCSGLASLDVSGFDTAQVTNMYYMFSGCSVLTSLDVSGFATSQVTSMNGMFRGCSGLTSLDVSGFDTAKVTSMGAMFSGCSKLTSLDVSGFDTTQVTTMQSMFQNCSALKTVYASPRFVTGAVTTDSDMFTGCTALVGGAGTVFDANHTDKAYARIDGGTAAPGYFTEVPPATFKSGESFNSTIKNLAGGAGNITAIRRSDTAPAAGVTTQSVSMAANDIVAWYDGSVIYWYSDIITVYLNEDCSGMLAGLTGLERFEFGSAFEDVDQSKLKNTSDMFRGCTALATARLELLDTSNVTDMSGMFADTAITRLSLFNVDTSKVENAAGMFPASLNAITLDKNVSEAIQNELLGMKETWYTTVSHVKPADDTSDWAGYTVQLSSGVAVGTPSVTAGGKITSYAQTLADGTFYDHADVTYATLGAGDAINKAIKSMASGKTVTSTDTADTKVTAFLRSMTPAPESVPASNRTSVHSGSTEITAWYDSGVVWYYTAADEIAFSTDGSKSSGYNLFKHMNAMQCADISGWNTFGWNGQDMAGMIRGCSSMLILDVSSIDTSNAVGMRYMFSQDSGLTSLNVSGFDISKVKDTYYMFDNCSRLTSIDVSHFDTAKVTDMNSMFYGCSSLTSLDVSGFDTSKVTSMASMFSGCSKLTSLDVSGFDTANVTTMYEMFYGCKGLISLDVSGFDTAKVTTMQQMFYGCSGLTTLDVSGFDTANVTNMLAMFRGCSGLASLDVSGFDTSKVTNMQQMFLGCSGLTSLDVSGFDTAKVTNMSYMFNGCSGLTSLDVSGFDTAKVTSMDSMFYNCSGLTSLDVSGFDTAKVKDMQWMFYGCSKLTTIYASSRFVTDTVTDSGGMFSGCSALVGGAGTGYSSHTDKAYARIDGGTALPGYFTALECRLKNGSDFNAAVKSLAPDDVSAVKELRRSDKAAPRGALTVSVADSGNAKAWLDAETGIVYWYSSAENIALPSDISGILAGLTGLERFEFGVCFKNVDTFAVTEIHDMFEGDTALSTVVLNDLDTSNVTDMSGMFAGCTELATLHLELCDTSNVTDMSEMFKGCESLGRLNLSGMDTASVTDCTDMFTGTDIHEVDVARGMGGIVQAALYELKPWYSMLDLSSRINHQLTSGMAATEASQMCRGTFYDHADVTYATLGAGNKAIKSMVSGTTVTSTDTADTKVTAFLRSMTPAPESVPASNRTTVHSGSTEITAWYDSGVVWYYTPADEIAFRTDGNGSGYQLFYNFNALRYADISGWNTLGGSGQSMYCMFNGCSGLTSLDVSGFDTTQVTNMQSMFASCKGLTSLDVSGFDTTNVTTMREMFYGCSGLTTLDVSGFDTSKVTTMQYMFTNCSKLTSLDVSGFATTQVTTMYRMFRGCSSLTSLDVSGFDTAKVTSMESMFWSCSGLTSLDVSGFDTAKVTSMDYMFSSSSGLTSLDVSGFDTANVTNMQSMFTNCSKLTSLDVSGFDTAKVTNMSYMFSGCSGLASLDVSGFDTTNVTTMREMFTNCSKLTSLDVSGFDTAKVTTMQSMFNGCSKLTTIYASSRFVTDAVTSSNDMFSGCSALVGGAGTGYDGNHVNKAYARIDGGITLPGYFTTRSNTFLAGASFNSVISELSGGAENIKNFTRSYGAPASGTDTVSVSQNAGEIIAWYSNGTVYWYSDAESVSLPAKCSGMFAGTGLSGLDFEAAFDGVDQSGVTDISRMFADCADLQRINLNGFNMSGATNTDRIFDGCTSLSEITVGKDLPDAVRDAAYSVSPTWYRMTGRVDENGGAMPQPTAATEDRYGYVKQLDEAVALENADQFYYGTFYDHADVTYATLATGDAINKAIKSMASGTAVTSAGTADTKVTAFLRSMTPAPESVPASNRTTVHSGSTEITAWYDSGVVWYYTAADEIAFRTDGSSSGYRLFDNFNALRYADISGWNTLGGSGQSMYSMFNGCSGLTSLDVSGFDTTQVTTMYMMFNYCRGLTSLDVSGFDTASVTDMGIMFQGCSGLTSLDVSGFDTAKVTSMDYMFSSCSGLTTLDVSGFDTSQVTNMQYMFNGCSGLASLDVSGFDTTQVTNMQSMFLGCSKLTSLDVSGFDTTQVTSMDSMFLGCSKLTSLDVSGFDTAQVTSMQSMFDFCSGLTTLDVSGFDTAQVTNMAYMFRSCSKLTTLDVSGFDTAQVTTMQCMFPSCSGLTTLDVSGFDTAQVTTMDSMFYGCSGLTSLDVSGFDTAQVTNMYCMFSGCSGLTSLDLSGFDTTQVTSMNSMFSGCSGLTSLDLSGFDTTQVTGMSYMFYGCSGLTSLDVSGFDTAKVTNMQEMFYGCRGLTTIYASSRFVTDAVTSSGSMFSGCSALVGGNGTEYSASHTDAEYARIDHYGEPGYFTENMEFAITYSYGDTPFAGQQMFADEAEYPTERMLSDTVTLPTEEDMVVPDGGYHLDGWLERGSSGWLKTPLYAIPEGERGVYVLTPNWVNSITYEDAEFNDGATVPTSYSALFVTALPGADDVTAPEGKVFGGWLIWDGEAWSEEPVSELGKDSDISGDVTVTPLWEDAPELLTEAPPMLAALYAEEPALPGELPAEDEESPEAVPEEENTLPEAEGPVEEAPSEEKLPEAPEETPAAEKAAEENEEFSADEAAALPQNDAVAAPENKESDGEEGGNEPPTEESDEA